MRYRAAGGGGTLLDPGAVAASPSGTDDTSVIAAAAVKAGAAGGAFAGTLLMNPGLWKISGRIPMPTGVRVVGAGKNATVIRKTSNVATAGFDFLGDSNAVRCQRGGMSDLRLDGGGFTGPLVRAKWADHLNFDRIWMFNNGDQALYLENVWDTYLDRVEFDTCSGFDGFKPAVLIASNADDSSNVIHFERCRWENFKDGALWVSSAPIVSAYTPVVGANPPYDIRLHDCKMETPQIRGLFCSTSADVSDMHIDGMYVAARGLYSGISSGRTLFSVIGASDMTFRRMRVRIDGVTNPTVDDVFTFNTSGHGFRLQDIFVDATQLPNTGIVSWDGGTPEVFCDNVRYKTGQAGVIYAGAAGNITQPTVASHATLMNLIRGPKVIHISGTVTVTAIPAIVGGREPVVLDLTAAATLTDGGNLKLVGNFVGPGQITLWCDGTNWYETGRTAPA